MRIAYTVINDITYDRRVERIATSLHEMGHDVVIIGFEHGDDAPPLPIKPYKQKRLKCIFSKGILFYLECNIRLLIYLLFEKKFDIYLSTDVDTALPCLLISLLKQGKYYAEFHEIFHELPSIINSPIKRQIWRFITHITNKSAKKRITISDSYARFYGIPLNAVVRNVPYINNHQPHISIHERNFILYRGYVNVGRGFDELIKAFHNIEMPLWVCGKGDYIHQAMELTRREGLEHKIIFKGWLTPHQLEEITPKARAGITIFDASGLSNYYSLANRFFDYINHLVPQIAMQYPEYIKINQRYHVAILIDVITPYTIASALNMIIKNEHLYMQMVENCKKAREELCWENEKNKLKELFKGL